MTGPEHVDLALVAGDLEPEFLQKQNGLDDEVATRGHAVFLKSTYLVICLQLHLLILQLNLVFYKVLEVPSDGVHGAI